MPAGEAVDVVGCRSDPTGNGEGRRGPRSSGIRVRKLHESSELGIWFRRRFLDPHHHSSGLTVTASRHQNRASGCRPGSLPLRL